MVRLSVADKSISSNLPVTMKFTFSLPILLLSIFTFGQTRKNEAASDSVKTRTLDSVTVRGYRLVPVISPLPDVHQTFIMAGKRSEVINVQDLPVNIAEKTGRQIFARIPGAFVYDMDGAGNQVNLATRGLDPHRSWEFNIRQNGVMINSDIYGYPASHYSPPMEAVKQVELVRGTASLQYGAEFGGMVNYVTKSADTSRQVGYENLTSAGSYGLLSSFHALGGKVGRFTYYTYYQKRVSDGYRDNAQSKSEAQFASLTYQFSRKLSLRAEVGRSTYLYQSPGPLTDSMFYANPRQATRSRNYFSPDMLLPSLTLNWKAGRRTVLDWVVSGVFGSRNSVEFEGFANRADLIDPLTLTHKPRTVNIDRFNSKTSELRILHHYRVGNVKSVLAAGVRYFDNDLHRRQQGRGSSGSDFDVSITGNWGRDLRYRSRSLAFSVENMFYLTPAFTVSPGLRYEHGKTDMSGYISYLDPADVPNRINHRILALGINAQYTFRHARLYGGISQAHRPVLFKDIIPSSTLERANKDLRNAFGYNAELGLKGQMRHWLTYELTLFQVQYNNRLGNVVLTENSTSYIYKTNVGSSRTNGVEAYVEITPIHSDRVVVSFFTATSHMRAIYRNASIAAGPDNRSINGNSVESVPRWISRNGLTLTYKTLTAVWQYSYVGESFADPANTVMPSANGAVGSVGSYGLWDFNVACRLAGRFTLRAGINNLANRQYFTKRPLFYPGPGVWSSDGRSLVASVGMRL